MEHLKYCKASDVVIGVHLLICFRLWTKGSKKRQSKYLFRFTRRYFRLRYRAVCYDSRPFQSIHPIIDYCLSFFSQIIQPFQLPSLFSFEFKTFFNLCLYNDQDQERRKNNFLLFFLSYMKSFPFAYIILISYNNQLSISNCENKFLLLLN